MSIKVITFGSLCEILGKEFSSDAIDTKSVLEQIFTDHPDLRERKLLISVNQKIVQQNTNLKDKDVVAIMPPYSGG